MSPVKGLQKFLIYGNCVATDTTVVPSFFYERSATPEELTETGIQNMQTKSCRDLGGRGGDVSVNKILIEFSSIYQEARLTSAGPITKPTQIHNEK